MRVITDRSARLRCGAIVKMCMERDLLYRYFDGDTTPDGYTVNADGAWTENGVVKTRDDRIAVPNGNCQMHISR